MLIIVTYAVLISMLLIVIRGLMGPTVYDRLLSGNAFGTQTVIIIVLLSFILENTSFLDIALIYALVNFITTIAFLRYFRLTSARGRGND